VVEPFEEGWSVEGHVQGSERKPYLVEVLLLPGGGSGIELEQFCSCPLGGLCKHGVALLELISAQPDWWLRPGQSPRERTPPGPKPEATRKPNPSAAAPHKAAPDQALKPALSSWVNRLAQSAAPATTGDGSHPTPASQAGSSQRIVYLLSPNQRSIRVDVATARSLKTGGISAPAQLPWSSLLGGSICAEATEDDRRLAREILFEQDSMTAWTYVLKGEAGTVLLRRLLGTERCYWQKSGKRASPLKLGPVRPAEPVWESQPDGSQRPWFKSSPPVHIVLPLTPLWYLDPDTSECGPLDIPLIPSAALTWLEAPVVDLEQAELVVAALSPQAERLKLPLPVALKVEWAQGVEPTPVLTLHGAPIPRASWALLWAHPKPQPDLGLGRLSFRYGSIAIPLHHASPVVQERTDRGWIRYPRNRASEVEREGDLRGLGLMPAPMADPGREWGPFSTEYVPSDDAEWMAFMREGVPELQEKGWDVVIEASFPWRPATAESWFIDAQSMERSADGPQQDWFGVELGVVVDGERINLLPILLKLLAADPHALSVARLAEEPQSEGIALNLPDGRKLMFPIERARTLQGVLLDLFEPGSLDTEGRLPLGRWHVAELAGEPDWRWLGEKGLRDLAVRLRDFQGIESVPPPAGLKAQLRHYQQDGLNWLQFLRHYGLGGILADDMGLGKTVQTLAHLLVEKESGRADRPSLVVAPTSLMTNWRQEAERFAPGLRVLVLHGLDRKDHFDRIRDHDLVLTTYPLLPRDGATLEKHEFHCLILDEAQFIKNPRTAAAQSVAGLRARHRLCLTGTPMENHLGELWSLFHFLMPGFLGDAKRFQRLFRTSIEKLGDTSRREILVRRVKPFLLRRRKEEVARELPAKNEIVQHVELEGPQRDLYESVRLAMHKRVREEVKKKGFSRAHIVILDALLKLRQICCHPALLKLPSAKAVRESAKLELLLELLPPMLEEGRRILLFSQFTSMLALIEAELKRLNHPYVLLTGDTRDRATPVKRFQSGEVPLFLISLKAGGTGLNLTAADTVIHYDPWWNPAVENQATDRAHRIGQDKQVFVYRLLTVGTVEEKIAALQARKSELVAGLLDTSGTGKLALTHEDLESLFSPVE
jgi:uncharacterized small protein (DUF1192 family)